MIRRNLQDITVKPTLFQRIKSLPGLAIFVVLGVLFHMVMLNLQIIAGVESGKWLQGQGTVTEARVVSHAGSDEKKPFYEVTVTYSYRVMGLTYAGNRATPGGGWFYGSEAAARAKAEELKKHPDVPVYFDLDDHSRAVLEQSVPERDVFGLFVSIPALGVGVGMLIFQLTKRKRLATGILAGIAAALLAGLAQWIIFARFLGTG